MKLYRSTVGPEHQVTVEFTVAHRTGEIPLFLYHPFHRYLAGRVIQGCSLSRRGTVEVDAQNKQQNADHQGGANQR